MENIEFKNVYIRKVEDGIFNIVLNRPKVMNPLNKETLHELAEAFQMCNDDPEVRVIIMRGEGGKSFVAGNDISTMSTLTPMGMRELMGVYFTRLNSVMSRCVKPIIGAVQGVAYGGGCVITMHCDVVFATDKSSFGQQEINLGLCGGQSRMLYLVGLHRGMDILLTGRAVSAQEAEQIGLINKCLPEEEFEDYVLAYARKLRSQSAMAIKLTKKSRTMMEMVNLEPFLHYEDELLSLAIGTEDGKEGVKAFLEKRQPNFTGN